MSANMFDWSSFLLLRQFISVEWQQAGIVPLSDEWPSFNAWMIEVLPSLRRHNASSCWFFVTCLTKAFII